MLDENALWRRCENAWAQWLSDKGMMVARLTDATNNTAHSAAPLIQIGNKWLRAPDLLATSKVGTEYWEVKTRSRPDVDQLTGQSEHWMEYAAYRNYLEAAEFATHVWVVLYETPTATSPGRWLQIDIEVLQQVGSRDNRRGVGGVLVDAWSWPVAEMLTVAGPPVEVVADAVPLLPEEGDEEALAPTEESALEKVLGTLAPVERTLRTRRRRTTPAPHAEQSTEQVPQEEPSTPSAVVLAEGPELVDEHWLDSEPVVALDVLRRNLGIPFAPRYSVLRVGLDNLDVEDLLGLLHYGIRVFLVVPELPADAMEATQLQAFLDSRMLEWAAVPEAAGCSAWVVDGQLDGAPGNARRAVEAADDRGDVNLAQYRIVHAPLDADVVVRAGAGTGKTETMAERVVFLLATSSARGRDASTTTDLRADEIALVTFTKESASEMRQRIARTLLLRQRLCQRCALPALAWMLQLASADIVTIHSLAKRITASGAGAIGLGPEFRVVMRTMEFRAAVYRALSDRLTAMIDMHPQAPAAYEWLDHVQDVWNALENNGIDLFGLGAGALPAQDAVDWGQAPGTGLETSVVDTTREVVLEVAREMRAMSLRDQTLPTNQLVPSATAALQEQAEPLVRGYRYLFVDEFQDTDAAQIDLVLELRERLDCRLFVVGDVKQGIYRFRGAEGNAFAELAHRVTGRGLPPMSYFGLTRNFRSGERLLGSLHPYFAQWGRDKLLAYSDTDRLRPRRRDTDTSEEIVVTSVPKKNADSKAADQVVAWRHKHPTDSVGILCRTNRQAKDVQAAIRTRGLSCDLRVGGGFYETPAVVELRVFLEAVADPDDDAALLELCETRWAPGVLWGKAPTGVTDEVWGVASEAPVVWAARVAAVGVGGSFRRDDLDLLRSRLAALRGMLADVPVLAWVVEVARTFEPEAFAVPDEDPAERARYGRCLDHLITQVDTIFGDGAITLERLLFWLRLQVATNDNEDEPDAETDGKVVALTVHKAKGLQFHRVLVPRTSSPFAPSWPTGTEVSVLRPHGEKPRLLWRWRPSRSGPATNVPLARAADWVVDALDTTREETRLLYVALTRAREELIVFIDPKAQTHRPPRSWAELIEGVL
ncbi:ATP-dependent helicase [Nocardioides sp. P86]|uniref:UvrD-helicase domain-containing protein n=1 Tax=Nocardioides sp. P86 TaxID=2939569 RepID=UPI00203F1B63|nr:ATP-dependent helicase [Nocardioides sp. P86]MCM3515474.1 ATP-dependent helicase [Nocardioides sp. P86]